MRIIKTISVTLLAILSIGVWGIAIFFFFTNEDSVPMETHALHQTYHVDKELIMYKNKQGTLPDQEIVHLNNLKMNFNKNRVSIDELLAVIKQEE